MVEPGKTKLRLFIAITLPDEVKSAIEETQAELRRALPGAAFRWTKRDQFHLTLRFLGSVEQSGVEELVRAMQDACRSFTGLSLRAGHLGFFPSGSRPRVLWAGIHDRGNSLIPLHKAIEAATTPFTQEDPEDRFKGHVTLARIKDISRSDSETLRRVASPLADRCFGEWTAREVELIQSNLSPTGARYTMIASAGLSGT